MSSEWNLKTLGEFCPFSYGKALPERNRKTGIIPVISSSGIVGYHNEALVKMGGVIIGRKGTVGNITLSEKPFWAIDTAFFVIDEPQKRDLYFTYYLLKTLNLPTMNSDSAVPGLNRENAHALLLKIPSLLLQKRISIILNVLDNYISLLQETNATLEAIAQALFKSWFVDFDPVRAKAEGRQPEGMDAETAALFPDSFEESELGLVPKGWRILSIGEVTDVGIGKTPPRKETQWFAEGVDSIGWVSIRDMGMAGAFISQTSECLTEKAVERFNIRLVPDNTVLLSFKLTIGRVTLTDGIMTTNEAIAHFKPHKASLLKSEYIYMYLKQFKYTSMSSTSSIADAVNSKIVKSIPILVPDHITLAIFHENVDSLFKRIKSITHQIATLAALRDTLLPPLISGRLRLPEANIFMEAI